MSKDPIRFTSQWALIGVIFFYSIGTTMIARHTKRIFKPASAGGSEHSRKPEKPNQPEPFVQENWQDRYQDRSAGLMQWEVDESDLTLYGVAFGTEQFYQHGDTYEQGNTAEPPRNSNTEEKSDTEEKKDVRQELTKIRTKIKYVETVLKKASIKPYIVNGQIKGLQINGLEKISEAKALLLKSGDIIIAVNGKSLSSKRDAYDIFKKARKEPIMIIDLLQDGKPKKYLLDFTSAPVFNLLK